MVYTFLDTGVLDELIAIPGYSNSEQSLQIKMEFQTRIGLGEKLIIPYAAMIEIGNHIAQIKNDRERQRCAVQFSEFLNHSRNNQAPWFLCTDGLNEEQIAFISQEFGEIGYEMKIGTGDLSIVYQYRTFSERVSGVAEDIQIWSLDHHIPVLQEKLGVSYSKKEIRRRRDR